MTAMWEWYRPYTQAELQRAQDMYGLVFPPDLIAMLSERHQVLNYDWRTENTAIRSMLDWPYEGLLFDVEQNSFWPRSWGDRPDHASDRADVLRSVLARVPKLIPLYRHRYIPESPGEVGNPVFSVYQTDIIYYGANLADYVLAEMGLPGIVKASIRHIPFWSDFAGGYAYDDDFDTGLPER